MTGKWVPNIYVLGENLGLITDYSQKPLAQWAKGKMSQDNKPESAGTIFSLWTNPVFTCSLKKKKSQNFTAGKIRQETIRMTRRRLVREGHWCGCICSAHFRVYSAYKMDLVFLTSLTAPCKMQECGLALSGKKPEFLEVSHKVAELVKVRNRAPSPGLCSLCRGASRVPQC